MNSLLSTIIARPYVFAFLAAYLFLSIRRWGATRALLWLITGYAIAWLSEYSSIHNGFPYGLYRYVYENLNGELLIAGIPFFDSLSYPFLIFAGFTTAEYIIKPDHGPKPQSLRSAVCGLRSILFFGALLTMFLDVIIDPIATMGDKWFLGRIHEYAHPGFYFGVPMTNFGGWFLVSLAVIFLNTLLWNLFPNLLRERHASRFTLHASRFTNLLYPLFYSTIATFNIVISFWVGETLLGATSSLILAVIIFIVLKQPAGASEA